MDLAYAGVSPTGSTDAEFEILGRGKNREDVAYGRGEATLTEPARPSRSGM